MDNLVRRTLTGIFIVIFVLGGFWLHPYSFVITGLLIVTGTQYEYYLMIRNAGVSVQVIPGVVAGIAIYTLSALTAAGVVTDQSYLMLFPLIAVIMVIELYRRNERPFDSVAHTLLPLLYTVIPLSLLPHSAFSQSGFDSILDHPGIEFSPGIVVGFLLLLWANDTGAYLVGITLGKHRLMERISPKKSWEGFFGGMIITAAAAWLLSGWLGMVERTDWIIISLIISVTGTYGDLVESMFKRSLGIKDSGNIMPGHGGFLDRFDSLIISFPVVFLYITLFG